MIILCISSLVGILSVPLLVRCSGDLLGSVQSISSQMEEILMDIVTKLCMDTYRLFELHAVYIQI